MISFFVAGIPAPQGSKRAFVVAGKARLVESSARCKPWRDSVRAAALEAMQGRGPVLGPVSVRVVFVLPRPRAVPRERKGWPATKPDVDKLLRATLDALTHAAFADDSQVVEILTRKVYAGSVHGDTATVGAEIDVGLVGCDHEAGTNRRGACCDCGEVLP